MNKLVTIIIPLYNTEKYISETIESVINQSYNIWELIIVNDGSTDNSQKIVEEFISKDSRIKLINKKNEGVAAARNTGIDNAKGEYIAFLDADDIWASDNLENKLKTLIEEDIDWVYSDMGLIDANTNIYDNLIGSDENIHQHLLLWDKAIIPGGPLSNILLKKVCFINNFCFDKQFTTAADQDFLFYLSKNYKGKIISKTLCFYRILNNSMSKNFLVVEKEHINVYKKAARNNLFHSFWFKHHCFSNMYLILAGNWWVNGNRKIRALKLIFLAILIYPPNVIQIIRKFYK